MRIQIQPTDHEIIISDELNANSSELYNNIVKALTGNGCLSFNVKETITVVPAGVLNTSIIRIVA